MNQHGNALGRDSPLEDCSAVAGELTNLPMNPACWLPDNAQVMGRPPFVYLGTLMTVAMLRQCWPLPLSHGEVARGAALSLLMTALALIWWGRRSLVCAHTNVSPARPTTAVVESGPYRHTRNPLYLGLTLIYIASSMLLNSWWGAVMLPVLLAYIHFGVVIPEERYLDRKFGEVYRRYTDRVRGYL